MSTETDVFFKITQTVYKRKWPTRRTKTLKPQNYNICSFVIRTLSLNLFPGVLTVAFIGFVGVLVGLFVLLVHPYDVLFKWVG